MSPSGVVKSSWWLHVIVPHRPRTYNIHISEKCNCFYTFCTWWKFVNTPSFSKFCLKFSFFLNFAWCVIVFFPPVLHWCSLNTQWRASVCSTEQEKSVQVTLLANPGCREMRARGPSKYQSSWAPKAWMRRNERVAWRTARSPVTTGNAFLLPFSVTIPSKNESKEYIIFLIWIWRCLSSSF